MSVALTVLPFAVLAQTEDEQVDVIAIFHQAQDLHEKGDLTRALKLYDKALKAMPEFPEAEFQRGMAFIALGKPDEAETAYRRAMELRPDWTLAMTGLGALL
ncbi:MAG: tetratricopeptide repeat protein, partial [Pyrinomonadaceae bacterium]